jgi:hypothetical protein
MSTIHCYIKRSNEHNQMGREINVSSPNSIRIFSVSMIMPREFKCLTTQIDKELFIMRIMEKSIVTCAVRQWNVE